MALALRVGPRVALELAPLRDFRQPARHALRFEFKLMPEPALRLDAADRQLDQRAGQQRLAVPGVEGIGRSRRRRGHDLHAGFSGSRPARRRAHQVACCDQERGNGSADEVTRHFGVNKLCIHVFIITRRCGR
ncbi:MAG TPA: hypothetical protein PKI20_08385 [Verrucomicrobiota bacterium]|nr:hypothetical protein [Verrucomicrobiota bacterium]HQL77726.1 hypothetical protein [Verrucomicrobiota bacterium]